MTLNSKQKAELIVSIADDMKAIDIETIDVHNKTIVTDYFVICTGTSDIHIKSVASKVEEKLKDLEIRPLRKDLSKNTWSLYDYGDVILHVMNEETRQFYNLEEFWKNKSNTEGC